MLNISIAVLFIYVPFLYTMDPSKCLCSVKDYASLLAQFDNEIINKY